MEQSNINEFKKILQPLMIERVPGTEGSVQVQKVIFMVVIMILMNSFQLVLGIGV